MRKREAGFGPDRRPEGIRGLTEAAGPETKIPDVVVYRRHGRSQVRCLAKQPDRLVEPAALHTSPCACEQGLHHLRMMRQPPAVDMICS